MQSTLRHVRLPNGLNIEFAEQGRRDGPSLLLLHGITDTWRSFEPVLPWRLCRNKPVRRESVG